jgi:tetratricopeptide (TPR) repeat protein
MRQCGNLVCCCVGFSMLLNAAQDRISEGKTALATGRYQDAVRLFEQERDASGNCEVYFYLGLARYRLKQLDQAIIDFKSAGQCAPANADLLLALAAAYADKGDDDHAVEALDSAIQLQPNNVEAIRAAAMLDLRHERNERAIGKLEKLVAIEKDNAQARSDLGAAYAGTGNLDKAQEQFHEALKLQPGNTSALMGLGNVYLKAGQNEKAVALLTEVAKAEPRSYEPRFLLASAYNALARYSDAVIAGEEALRLGGTDSEIYYHLAKAYRGLGRTEEQRKALERFSELRARSDREGEARREAGRLIEEAKPLVDAGKLRDAISLLERAYSLDRRNPQVVFRLAGLYYDTQQNQAARRYVAEAIALAPSEWRYHYLLGLVEKAAGRPDAARDSFETTVRLNPSAADPFNQLGNLAMGNHDFAGASRYFEKAARLDPDEQAYQLNLNAARQQLPTK